MICRSVLRVADNPSQLHGLACRSMMRRRYEETNTNATYSRMWVQNTLCTLQYRCSSGLAPEIGFRGERYAVP